MVQAQHGRHNNIILELSSIWLTLYLNIFTTYLYNLSQSLDWDKFCSFLIHQRHIFMTFPIIYHITALHIWNLWVGVSSTSTLGVCQKLLVSPLLVVIRVIPRTQELHTVCDMFPSAIFNNWCTEMENIHVLWVVVILNLNPLSFRTYSIIII